MSSVANSMAVGQARESDGSWDCNWDRRDGNLETVVITAAYNGKMAEPEGFEPSIPLRGMPL